MWGRCPNQMDGSGRAEIFAEASKRFSCRYRTLDIRFKRITTMKRSPEDLR